MTEAMTPDHWQAAQAIALELSTTETDVNELKKIVSYLGWLRNRQEKITGDRLFEYLATLAQHGEVRSNKTPQYYQTIERVCRSHLEPFAADGNALIQILGWAARLHR